MANLMLSFGSPGIPSGGFMISLPFYLAAGAPIEGVVLLRAVDAVPDIFKTVVNVTADMTAATIVERFDGVARVAAHATAGAMVVSGADGVAVPVRVPAAALDAMHEREPIA
jgi:Na+/H+-dicarboxylate symporter